MTSSNQIPQTFSSANQGPSAGFYLITSGIRALILDYFTHAVAPWLPPNQCYNPRSQLWFLAGRLLLVWEGQILLCRSLDVPVWGAAGQGPWTPPSVHLHSVIWSLGFSPTSRIFLPIEIFILFWDPCFFLENLLVSGTSSFWKLGPWIFQSK